MSKEVGPVATNAEKIAVRATLAKNRLAIIYGSQHFKSTMDTKDNVGRVQSFVEGESKYRNWCDFILSDKKYNEKIAEDLLGKDKQVYQTNFQRYEFIQQFATRLGIQFGVRYVVGGKEVTDPALVEWLKVQLPKMKKRSWNKPDKILSKKTSLIRFFHSIVNEIFDANLPSPLPANGTSSTSSIFGAVANTAAGANSNTTQPKRSFMDPMSRQDTKGFKQGNRIYDWDDTVMKIIESSSRCPPQSDLKEWAAKWLDKVAGRK